MQRAHPKLSFSLTETTVEDMVDDGELESAYLHDEVAVNCNVVALKVIDALLENTLLTGAHLSCIVARDVVLRRCDLSLASLDNGMLVRVEFINCRLTGTDFSRTNIHDVTFKDCKLDAALFDKADLRRVGFIDCSLQGVNFDTARLVDVAR